jgi:hypothetical protein
MHLRSEFGGLQEWHSIFGGENDVHQNKGERLRHVKLQHLYMSLSSSILRPNSILVFFHFLSYLTCPSLSLPHNWMGLEAYIFRLVIATPKRVLLRVDYKEVKNVKNYV